MQTVRSPSPPACAAPRVLVRAARRCATLRCAAASASAPPQPGQLREWGRANGVKYFLVSYTDLFGVPRSKLVPTEAMPEMEKTGASFAAFATYVDSKPSEPDTFALPDAACAVVLPWKREVAWVPADIYCRGAPIEHAPRNLLKAQVAKAAAKGLVVKSGVEVEFFLLTADGKAPADERDDAAKPCYNQQALMRRYDVIARVCDYMAELGWKPYQNDHEDANGQFEMNWDYDDVLVTADRHAFFKFMLRTVAEEAGLRCTFMPKPFANRTGSGAHVHVSAWGAPGTARAGENLFQESGGELGLSPLAYSFFAGVLASAEGLTAITNPTVNSYKRLNATVTRSGATWSPNTVTYTGNNRTHMIRIPDGNRFEFRLPDGATNPYLVQAALVGCGLAGVEAGAHPGARSDYNGAEERPPAGTRTLPSNLLDALRAMEADGALRSALGAPFVTSYAKLKMRDEWLPYAAHLSSWELDATLDV